MRSIEAVPRDGLYRFYRIDSRFSLSEIPGTSFAALALIAFRDIFQFAARENRLHLDFSPAGACKLLRGTSRSGILTYLTHTFSPYLMSNYFLILSVILKSEHNILAMSISVNSCINFPLSALIIVGKRTKREILIASVITAQFDPFRENIDIRNPIHAVLMMDLAPFVR